MKLYLTTVMKSVVNLESKLKSWEINWEWAEKLKFASIGSPKELINDMKNGMFQPDVSDGAKRSAVRKMKVKTKHHNYNISELQHDWDAICDFFDGEGLVLPQSYD